ncbi:MAG: membrane dipeptidase, partial [Bdellovibrionota bacterium]
MKEHNLKNSPIFLDAAAPMLEPRVLSKHLPGLLEGEIDVALATVGALEGFRQTMLSVGKWLELERTSQYPICIARTVSDIRQAKLEKKISIVIHFQGAEPIEDKIDFLNIFQKCGLRVMQLTYNSRNRIGDGCFEESNVGISAFGKQVIRRMEELSIAIDLAHAGVRSSLEALEIATKPVIVSHA